VDDYPKSLAPNFDESGRVISPFEDWWGVNKNHFSNVPDEVAREWLHRHWGQSPFGWLPSKKYAFSLQKLDATKFTAIRTSWSRFKSDNTVALMQGMFICGDDPKRQWRTEKIWLEEFMRENMSFPTPLILLDNRDGHLEMSETAPPNHQNLPNELILIEGHTRLNIALYLQSIDAFENKSKIYLMTHKI